MTDEVVDGDGQQVNPEIEAEARRGGWKPKDQWHGDPKIWVDASKFVERGKELAPHLARTAADLRRENEALKAAQTATAAELAETRKQVEGLTTFRTEMAGRERERIRGELIGELAAAREAGDFAAEAVILGKLGAPPPAPEPVKPAPVVEARTTPQVPPEMTAWVGANDWYKKDPVLQQAMNLVGADLRASGQLEGMNLTEQLNATAKIVLQRYAPAPTAGGRVEGGRPSGEGGGSRNLPQSGYESLPAEIKSACDAQGERLSLIGPKAAFKTKEAWREHYAKEYNRYASGTGYDFRPPGN